MAIKRHVQWLNNKFYGYVDNGSGVYQDDLPVAKDAFVFLVVSLTQSWKLPIVYFFVDGLGGEERKCLILLHQNNVQVECSTFDGAAANISMARKLRADFDIHTLLKTSFLHPVTKNNIEFFYPCHMVKLVRNTFGEWGYIKDSDDKGIKYSYIKKMN